MGTIICQSCKNTIAVFDGEKVTTLYANSNDCTQCNDTKDSK